MFPFTKYNGNYDHNDDAGNMNENNLTKLSTEKYLMHIKMTQNA